jgi:hypothetical protein
VKITFQSRTSEETNDKYWNMFINFRGNHYCLSFALTLFEPWWGIINTTNEEEDFEDNTLTENKIIGLNLYFFSVALGRFRYYELEN